MNEITYIEAIRKVHPDTNPSIEDAGTKVRLVQMYKSEPRKLFLLMKEWGLVDGIKKIKKEIFREVLLHNLFPNTNYFNDTVWIHHIMYQGRFQVLRTTSKRVYFKEETIARTGMKFCNINSVYNAFRTVKEEKYV